MDADYRDSAMIDRYVNRERHEEGERSVNNVPSLVIFALFVLSVTGVIIGVAVLNLNEYAKGLDKAAEFLSVNKVEIIILICIPTLTMFSYTFLLRLWTKFFIVWGILLNDIVLIFSIPIFIIMSFLYIFVGKFKSSTYEILVADVILIFLVIYKVAALIATSKVKLNSIIEITKESCRAIFHFPLLMIFTYTFFVTGIVLSICVIYGYGYLFSGKLENFADLYLYTYINIGFFVIINFLMYFVQSVISDCIATWYWSEEKCDVRQVTLFKSIKKVLKYQLGTVAYASSCVFPIIQTILVLFKIKSKHVLANEERHSNKFVSFVTRIYLAFQISEFALIHSLIDGHSFYESSKKSCVLALRYPSRFNAMLESFSGALNVGFFIVVLVTMFVINIMPGNSNTVTNPMSIVLEIVPLCFTVLMPIYLMLCTSVRTIIMCTLEDLSVKDRTVESLNLERQYI